MTTAIPSGAPDRRLARPSPLSIALAAAVLAGIAFATLCPIGLRPHLASANAERFAAFALLGAAVGMAAGRRALAATALVVLAAFALEAAQGLAPGRDPALSDALVKALGGVLGSAGAQLAYPLRRLIARRAVLRPNSA
ncbi:MAG: hypothetical protein ACJ798_01330 [Phenylobacterium sp.]